MAEQLSLAGIGEARAPTDRIFYGIIPDQTDAVRIEETAFSLRARHGLTGHLIPADRLHVTLCHIGDYDGLPAHFVEQAKETASKIKMPPFDAMFDRVMSFRGGNDRNPFVLGTSDDNAALHELRQSLFTALKTYGPGCRSGSKFTPHITLLYDDRLVAEHPIEPLRLQFREFVLIHSLLNHKTHIHVARWPLLG